MRRLSTTKRYIFTICLVVLLAFFVIQIAYIDTAVAEPSSYSVTIEENDGRYTLQWDAYVGTFDYYVITLNGDTLIDGHKFAYLDITNAISVGGEYQFDINISFVGDLTQIATASIVRNINLQKVSDVQIANDLATWTKIDGATDYDVIINGIKVANTTSTSISVADFLGKTDNYSIQILPKHGENPHYSTDNPTSFAFEHTEYASFDGYPVYFALYDTLTASLENCADTYRYVVTSGDNCVFEQETADNFISLPQEENKIYSLYIFAVYDTHIQLLNTTQYSVIDEAVKIYD